MLWLILVFNVIACQNSIENEPPTTEIVDSSIETLVDVQAVKAMIDEKASCIIFEISKQKKYAEGHLPNAFNLWRPDYEQNKDYPYSGLRASKEQMEQLLSKYSVTPTTKIILYDTKGGSDAIRVWWLLTHYGHKEVLVMDGGKKAWEEAGFPLSQEASKLKNETKYVFQDSKKKQKMIAWKDVKAAIEKGQTIILDTREPEEYHGEPYISKGKLYRHKKGAFAAGCIPGAIHLNWSDAVDLKGNHCIKSIKDLKYNFEKAGITPDKEIIVYCQSGVRSSHTIFVLTEILGYPNVVNYDGSWIEWSYHHVHGNLVEIEQHTSEEMQETIYEQLGKELTSKEKVLQ